MVRRLGSLQHGRVRLCDNAFVADLGEGSTSSLAACLSVQDARFYPRLICEGSLGFAESYLNGEWTTDNLTGLLQIFARNLDEVRAVDRWHGYPNRILAGLRHRLSRNTRRGSRRNIHRHYDLSNDFFATFLDRSMMYSSAIFEEPNMTLEQASTAKLETICRKLDLQPDDHLLEIGTGWGGLATYAASNFGCRVTTTTISRQQYDFARQRIEEAGLTDRITLLIEDYRDLEGQYDKLVSIEMLEAVGHQYYGRYFDKCNSLLKSGGQMLVQTITIPEQRYERYRRSVDFIQQFIFPGGCLPSLAAIQQAVGESTQFRLLNHEDFGPSYARTLREWCERFQNRVDDVRDLGFDDRFLRMWHYYLCYCEAAFLERAVGVSHLSWVKK